MIKKKKNVRNNNIVMNATAEDNAKDRDADGRKADPEINVLAGRTLARSADIFRSKADF